MTCTIRPATPADTPAVLNLIRELAAYEKAPNEVVVSIEEMNNWGFGKDKLFDCLVAENGANIVGIAITYFKYSTWKGRCLFLEDIIVTESYRRRGIGEQLFFAVMAFAKKQAVRRLEWQVLAWNEPAINFYKKHGAVFDNEWINCKFTAEQL